MSETDSNHAAMAPPSPSRLVAFEPALANFPVVAIGASAGGLDELEFGETRTELHDAIRNREISGEEQNASTTRRFR